MEHDDISLDSKPSNRQNAGRYGSKTNKTIKYSRNAEYDHRKGPETIVQIEDTHREGWEVSYRGAEKSVGISLNARKNWEWVEKQVAHQEGHNNLRRSQDDFEVDYSTRVAVLQASVRTSTGERQEQYYKIYGSPNKTAPEEEKMEYVSGENRKGFYVKEKRRKGKKGVKRDTLSPNNNRRPRSRSDAGNESSSASSDEENGEQLAQQVERVLVVEKKDRKMDLSHCPNRSGCQCPQCNGWEKNIENKRRAELKKMDIDAL